MGYYLVGEVLCICNKMQRDQEETADILILQVTFGITHFVQCMLSAM